MKEEDNHCSNKSIIIAMEKYKNKFRINSARANWHDYNSGLYFITICTQAKVCYFGEIINGEMQLNELGKVAVQFMKDVNSHYPCAEVPLFVIMPNHVHAIISIDDKIYQSQNHAVSGESKDLRMQQVVQNRGVLSDCIAKYKAAVTRYANKNNVLFNWQARFHDHIIRDAFDLNKIADYIENNPKKWEVDKFYL